jgi:uncharacterized protein (DUF2384 family)
MATSHLLNNPAEMLRSEILSSLPFGQDWLSTPHQLLGGRAPEDLIAKGELEPVSGLLHSILYVGVA